MKSFSCWMFCFLFIIFVKSDTSFSDDTTLKENSTLGASTSIRDNTTDIPDPNECKPDEFCVRLCCAADSLDSNCPDLNSMPKDKKLNDGYRILKGKPCEGEENRVPMLKYENLWEFLPVSFLKKLRNAIWIS